MVKQKILVLTVLKNRKGAGSVMIYANPNTEGAVINFKEKYENYIGGQWVAPVKGEYFDNVTPVTGEVFTKAAKSTAEDIELALEAAHKAKEAWGKTSATERANILNKIADRIEENLELIAVAETWEKESSLEETSFPVVTRVNNFVP